MAAISSSVSLNFTLTVRLFFRLRSTRSLFFDEHSVFFRFDISRLKQLQLGAEYPLSHVHLHLEREQLQMKSLRLGKLIGYQLCRALPQPWGHIGISLVPKNVVRYQSSKALSSSLTCWEGSCSSYSRQSSRQTPSPARVGEREKWSSVHLATCPSRSGSCTPGSCSGLQRWSAGTLRSWSMVICQHWEVEEEFYLTRPGWFE